jgi:hypothetical protein
MTKKDFTTLMVLISALLIGVALSGCSTFKGLADYRAKQKDKCVCPQVWGDSW